MNKFKKNQKALTRVELDLRKTGGPLIPKGTPVTVEIVRRGINAGYLWVDVQEFGHRHLGPEHLIAYSVEDASEGDEPNFFIHDSDGNQIGDNITDLMDAERLCEGLNNGTIKPDQIPGNHHG
jgi:hypothetical protein